jgi:hypothetical protein
MGWFAITVMSILSVLVSIEGVFIYLLLLSVGKIIFEHGKFMRAVYEGFAATDKNFLSVGKTFHDLAETMANLSGTSKDKLPDLPPPDTTGGNLMN